MSAATLQPAAMGGTPGPRGLALAPDYRRPHDLVAGLVDGDEAAAVAFFAEYSRLVERTVARIVGLDAELADIVQDAFIGALRSVHAIRDPQALTEWVRQIAVRTAVDWVRRRKRRRWLMLVDPHDLKDQPDDSSRSSEREALRATYAVLERLPVEERAVFALRHIEGLELTEIAAACGFSLATVKRRLTSADERFRKLARQHAALAEWTVERSAEEP